MKQMKYRYVFKQKLAGYLMQRGFVLLRMNTNLDDNYIHVFLFKDSPVISQAIAEYENDKEKRNL